MEVPRIESNLPANSEREPDGQIGFIRSTLIRAVPWFVGLIVLGIVLNLALQTMESSLLIQIVQVIIILVAGLLPLFIYGYFRDRRRILFDQYRQNLRRLGFPDRSKIYESKFVAVYGPSKPDNVGIPLLQSPLLIATLLSFLGWILVFYPTDPGNSVFTPKPSPIVYGFLGAYLFGITSLVRQYVTDDLQLRYYASLTNRYLVVLVLSWMIGILVPQTGITGALSTNLLIAAFIIGMFPTFGLRLAARVGTKILGIGSEAFNERQPLTKLEGLNAYHEDRLQLEGVESIQNLVCADIVELMLKTRFNIEQIVDWMDQALLHLHAHDWVEQLKLVGLRTATDVLDAYTPSLPVEQLKQWHENLARLSSTLEADATEAETKSKLVQTESRFEAIILALRVDPNMFHIRYWRDHPYEALPDDVERDRIPADLKLMRGFFDEAVTAYDEVLRNYPGDRAALLYRGFAHFQMKHYEQAIDDYQVAVSEGAKWENVRLAYLELGRALREMGAYTQSADSYSAALKGDVNFAEAHLELAYLQMSYLHKYDEAIEHLQIAVDGKFKRAEALTNLGVARSERWRNRGALPETKSAELEQARADHEHALRLRPDLIAAYLNLGDILEMLGKYADAQKIYTDALTRTEIVRDNVNGFRALLRRGNIYLRQRAFKFAVEDYTQASKLVPTDAAAFFNLGTAHRQLGDKKLALQAFRDAVRLNPEHGAAYQALGEVAVEEGLFEEAEKAFSDALSIARAVQDTGAEASAHLYLGKLYRRLGTRNVDATRELQQAREQDQGMIYTEASFEYGMLELQKNNFKAAAELLQTSAELYDVLGSPRASAEANLELAHAQLKLQEMAKADVALKKARAQLADVFDPRSASDGKMQDKINSAQKEIDSFSTAQSSVLALTPLSLVPPLPSPPPTSDPRIPA